MTILELWRADRARDNMTMHIIQRASIYQKFAVCWNFDGKEWDWGTYCHTFEQAQGVFYEKYIKNHFRDLKTVNDPVISLEGEL